jgi:hypothetical protein
MARSDLLALSADDLAALTNRGTVKEARAELESSRCSGQLAETPEGSLRVQWSDGLVSELAAGAALRAGRCSCNKIGTCKHLIRLVLLYQKQTAAASPEEPPVPAEPWDPGAISDEELARHYRPQALTKARKLFEAGVMAELVRGIRPIAQMHMPVCTVRFLVPGDLRYTRCNCADPPPCLHVPLAVWAFRQLPAEQHAGIVTAGTTATPLPAELLDRLEAALLDFAEQGVSSAGRSWIDQLARLEQRCREADLVWPAEILAELIQQQECYAGHDSRFAPERVAALVGELVIRHDAIRNDTGALPQLLIRGSAADRPMELGKGLYWGLGCGVWPGRRGVELAAYLHDCKSGDVLAISKEIPDGEEAPDKPPRTFSELAHRSAVRGNSFATVGIGILQMDGGKRSSRHELLPGRANAGVMVQDRFTWEEIQPPVLIEDFAEMEDRLASLPPSALRPRRVAEDFHVLRVAKAEEARFDNASHSVQALLVDRRGRKALLVHPWTTRGAAGAEALLARLTSSGEGLLFVSGLVSRAMGGVVVRPVCLVWQDQGRRSALQPWVERQSEVREATATGEVSLTAEDASLEYIGTLQRQLGELIVLGLARADAHAARAWGELVRQGEAVGFGRLAARVAGLATALEQKAHTLRWDVRAAGGMLLELAALARLAQDMAG